MTSTPCDWPVSYADCSGECTVYQKWPEDERAAVQQDFEKQAIDLLWAWTNRVFGTCPVELRPCSTSCASGRNTFWGRGPYPWAAGNAEGATPWLPVLVAGQWYNVSCGCLAACDCGLSGATALALPGPVVSIDEVLIDGAPLAASAYRLDYGRLLIRTDGERWPACQDLAAADDAPGSFVVRYQRGLPVPAAGQAAAGRLACELAKAACNDGTCALPRRLSTITREGVTMGFQDMFEDIDKGHTGIWSIDSWVASVRQPRAYASVRSPDVPSGPRATAGRTPWPR